MLGDDGIGRGVSLPEVVLLATLLLGDAGIGLQWGGVPFPPSLVPLGPSVMYKRSAVTEYESLAFL